ncbi:MAG: hypothetical protein ITG01_05450 [Comamonas sp.]|nr:hypothetical protein [Comamonas sp.]
MFNISFLCGLGCFQLAAKIAASGAVQAYAIGSTSTALTGLPARPNFFHVPHYFLQQTCPTHLK